MPLSGQSLLPGLFRQRVPFQAASSGLLCFILPNQDFECGLVPVFSVYFDEEYPGLGTGPDKDILGGVHIVVSQRFPFRRIELDCLDEQVRRIFHDDLCPWYARTSKALPKPSTDSLAEGVVENVLSTSSL